MSDYIEYNLEYSSYSREDKISYLEQVRGYLLSERLLAIQDARYFDWEVYEVDLELDRLNK